MTARPVHRFRGVHPYREPAKLPVRDVERESPQEETILAILVLVVGGVRVLAAALAREPLDGEGTLALVAAVVATWCLIPRDWLRARSRRRRAGVLHDDRS